MLTLAEQILHSKAGEFDPATFRDRYEEALLAHLKVKQAGAVPERRKTFAPPQRVIALEPYDKGLLGTTLRYPYEVRKAEDYFCDLPDLTIAPDMLTLAEHILDSKASEFDPATFRDRYEEALLAHLKAKQAGAVPERRRTFAPPHRVVNLMEALRRSVAEDTKGAAARKGASATPARKRA